MKLSSTLALQAPLSAATLLRGPIGIGIERSCQIGFDGVELQLYLSKDNQPNFYAIAERCKALNVSVCAYATGSLYVKDGLSLVSDDPNVVNEALNRLRLYIEGAAITGGKVVIGCIRGNIDDSRDYFFYEERLAKNMRRLLDMANDSGVKVVFEAINRYENNYLATTTQCVEFIQRYDLKELELLLDTFHMNIEEINLIGALNHAARYLGHVHLADNNRYVPGMGCLPFPMIISELKKIGYNGWLSLECSILKNEEAEATIGLEYIKKLL